MHEGLTIFCHFFNNNKTCPFNNGCVFVHEDSEVCKYDTVCERRNCMYKHGIDDSGDESDNIIEDEDKDDAGSIHDIGEEILAEDEIVIDDAKEKVDSEVDEDAENETDDNLEEGPVETLEYDVFVPCRDHFLTKDSGLYHQQLNNMKEIERVQNIWITAKNEYKVGDYLAANIKFTTKYAEKWKTSEKFRIKIWDRLSIKQTCPEQGEVIS